MNVKSNSVMSLALCASAVISMVGCKSEPMPVNAEGQYTGTAPHARPGATYIPERKPVAKTDSAPAPAPAPAARPVAAAPTGSDVMYIPTGERSTSALMIEKIYPRTVSVGQSFDYVIKATNIGGNTLNNVTVNEANPTNFTVASVTPSGNNGSYNLGNLNPGESKTITWKGSAAGLGTINACASANYTYALCHAINVVQPALAITKTITPESILNCTPINMTVEVKNTGTGDAVNVHIMDQLPAGLTLANGATSFDEVVGTIPPGGTKTISKDLKAASVGRFENMASTKADGVSPVNSNRVATVVKQPKIEIACKAGGQVYMGRDACFEMTVTNKGDAPSNNTKVTVNVPNSATVSQPGEGGSTAAGVHTINMGTVAPGASVTRKFCLKTVMMGSLSVSATATGDCAAPASTNCSITIFGAADIGTIVTDTDGAILVGDNHPYQVEVKNQGPTPLTNTKMIVSMPAGMEFISSAKGKLVGGKVVFDFGTVPPNSVVTGEFVVKVNKSGEFLVTGETTCAEIKTPVRDDELTTFIDR